MGLLDNLRNQVSNQWIEIIEWLDNTSDTMVYRFPVYNQEIKMGAKLVVRENQAALFINEGKATDLFSPGTYTLSTQNMPILADLRGWKYGFQSPFKAEVYFFNTKNFVDLKWGTANPVMMRDADFGMIRMRAYGTYTTRISDPKTFFATVVGTQGLTTTDEILGQLRSSIVSRLSESVANAHLAALDLAANYDRVAQSAKQVIGPDFSSFGLELSRFFVENISLPEEVEAAIDQRSRLGVLGDRMAQYTQLQSADAIRAAADNPGGLAGAGVGLGAGVAMGNAMSQAMNNQGPPPPPPGAAPRWSIAVDGKTFGPYTDAAIKSMIASGEVARSAMAWRPGAAAWAPVESYPELVAANDVPPPPPPPPPR